MAEVLDVAGEDLRDPQPVVDEQAHERRRPRPMRLGRRQQAVELLGGQRVAESSATLGRRTFETADCSSSTASRIL